MVQAPPAAAGDRIYIIVFGVWAELVLPPKFARALGGRRLTRPPCHVHNPEEKEPSRIAACMHAFIHAYTRSHAYPYTACAGATARHHRCPPRPGSSTVHCAHPHTHTHTHTQPHHGVRSTATQPTQRHSDTYSMATYCLLPTPSVPPLPATPPPSPASASPPLCLSAPDRRRDRLPWRLLEPRLDRWPPLLAPSPSQVLGVALKPMAAAALASPPLPWWWRRRDPPREEGRDRCLAHHTLCKTTTGRQTTLPSHMHRNSTVQAPATASHLWLAGAVAAVSAPVKLRASLRSSTADVDAPAGGATPRNDVGEACTRATKHASRGTAGTGTSTRHKAQGTGTGTAGTGTSTGTQAQAQAQALTI